jgi:hypothetical protein
MPDLPSNVRAFGDLLVQTTTSFTFCWNDKGSGAKRDGAFWHPPGVNDMQPLGSVAVSGYGDIKGKHAVLLVGPKWYGAGQVTAPPQKWYCKCPSCSRRRINVAYQELLS